MHIVWDFDGTIVDSFSGWKTAAIDHCSRNSLPVPDDNDLRHSFGHTSWQGFDIWDMSLSDHENHRLAMYDQFYVVQKNNPESFSLVNGLSEVIFNLEKMGFVQSIVTSRWHEPLVSLLDYYKIHSFFSFLGTRDRALQRGLVDKPAPDKLFDAIDHVGISKNRTIVIGDTVMDIGMAQRAGCSVIAVDWGFGDHHQLCSAAPCTIVSSVGAISGFVMKKFLS